MALKGAAECHLLSYSPNPSAIESRISVVARRFRETEIRRTHGFVDDLGCVTSNESLFTGGVDFA